MARRLVFRREAEDDVLEVRGWYEARQEGLGRQFGASLAAVVERIAEHPHQFPRVHRETRRAVLSRFPYALYFRTHADTVVVLALHGRQHPSRWKRRL